MKSILCYGDSNVWGNIPGSFDPETSLSKRYTKDKRWTGILQKELDDYDVIEVACNARTTNLDEIIPGRPFKNGLKELPVCLETHYPIDLVMLWLGTNDTKKQFNRSPAAIAEGLRELIKLIKACNKGANGGAPKILIIAPQPLLDVPTLHEQLDKQSVARSKDLASLYQALAKEENCEFFDAGLVVSSSEVDGVHLDEAQCLPLGKAIAQKVKQII